MAFFAGGHVTHPVSSMSLGRVPYGPLKGSGWQLHPSHLAALIGSRSLQQGH